MLLGRFTQQPVEVRRYDLDYSKRLAEQELLTAIEGIDVSPVTVPPVSASATLGAEFKTVGMFVQGGIDGIDYVIQIRVNTNDGSVLWEDELEFSIEEID